MVKNTTIPTQKKEEKQTEKKELTRHHRNSSRIINTWWSPGRSRKSLHSPRRWTPSVLKKGHAKKQKSKKRTHKRRHKNSGKMRVEGIQQQVSPPLRTKNKNARITYGHANIVLEMLYDRRLDNNEIHKRTIDIVRDLFMLCPPETSTGLDTTRLWLFDCF